MKKAILATMLASAVLATGCSSMKEVENRKTYAQPSWYQECEQHATEGYFWWSKEYVYACGAGESGDAHRRDRGKWRAPERSSRR